MGTRALIHIKEAKTTLTTIYCQYDGYPQGLGKNLFDILEKGQSGLVSGFGVKQTSPKIFNGMGCLAAYLIGELKEKTIGGVYICKANSSDNGEAYTYTLYNKKDVIYLSIFDNYCKTKIYKGALNEFDYNKFE